jgi:hypothetical protein
LAVPAGVPDAAAAVAEPLPSLSFEALASGFDLRPAGDVSWLRDWVGPQTPPSERANTWSVSATPAQPSTMGVPTEFKTIDLVDGPAAEAESSPPSETTAWLPLLGGLGAAGTLAMRPHKDDDSA